MLTISENLPVRDQMNTAQFDAMMEKGMAQAQARDGMDLDEAFEQIARKKLPKMERLSMAVQYRASQSKI